MDDNVIKFSEEELVVLGSLNLEKTQVNFNECIFNKKASFPLTQIEEAEEICQKLSQSNQICLLVRHQDCVSIWEE